MADAGAEALTFDNGAEPDTGAGASPARRRTRKAAATGRVRGPDGKFASSSSSSSPSSGKGRGKSLTDRLKGGDFEPVPDKAAAATVAKLLILLTLVLMYYRLRRHQIPDRDGTLAEELALTDEEACEIARPIARYANSTVAGARVLGPIVRNEDVIGAMFALYEYQRRTEQVLERYGLAAPVTPENEKRSIYVDTAPDARSGSNNGGPVGPIDWGAPHDHEAVNY